MAGIKSSQIVNQRAFICINYLLMHMTLSFHPSKSTRIQFNEYIHPDSLSYWLRTYSPCYINLIIEPPYNHILAHKSMPTIPLRIFTSAAKLMYPKARNYFSDRLPCVSTLIFPSQINGRFFFNLGENSNMIQWPSVTYLHLFLTDRQKKKFELYIHHFMAETKPYAWLGASDIDLSRLLVSSILLSDSHHGIQIPTNLCYAICVYCIEFQKFVMVCPGTGCFFEIKKTFREKVHMQTTSVITFDFDQKTYDFAIAYNKQIEKSSQDPVTFSKSSAGLIGTLEGITFEWMIFAVILQKRGNASLRSEYTINNKGIRRSQRYPEVRFKHTILYPAHHFLPCFQTYINFITCNRPGEKFWQDFSVYLRPLDIWTWLSFITTVFAIAVIIFLYLILFVFEKSSWTNIRRSAWLSFFIPIAIVFENYCPPAWTQNKISIKALMILWLQLSTILTNVYRGIVTTNVIASVPSPEFQSFGQLVQHNITLYSPLVPATDRLFRRLAKYKFGTKEQVFPKRLFKPNGDIANTYLAIPSFINELGLLYNEFFDAENQQKSQQNKSFKYEQDLKMFHQLIHRIRTPPNFPFNSIEMEVSNCAGSAFMDFQHTLDTFRPVFRNGVKTFTFGKEKALQHSFGWKLGFKDGDGIKSVLIPLIESGIHERLRNLWNALDLHGQSLRALNVRRKTKKPKKISLFSNILTIFVTWGALALTSLLLFCLELLSSIYSRRRDYVVQLRNKSRN